MDIKQLKKLIKDSVREVLREELQNLGKQKLQEQAESSPWPTISRTTDNVAPVNKQSLMEKMGLVPDLPSIGSPSPPSTGGNPYMDLLKQTAEELVRNPSEINNFKNFQ
jgi:hypothetical protein